jgi:hypothetical protein
LLLWIPLIASGCQICSRIVAIAQQIENAIETRIGTGIERRIEENGGAHAREIALDGAVAVVSAVGKDRDRAMRDDRKTRWRDPMTPRLLSLERNISSQRFPQ